jgi:hypothetical protein
MQEVYLKNSVSLCAFSVNLCVTIPDEPLFSGDHPENNLHNNNRQNSTEPDASKRITSIQQWFSAGSFY